MCSSSSVGKTNTYRLHTFKHDTIVSGLPRLPNRVHGAIELAFSFHATAATLTLDRLHFVFLCKRSGQLIIVVLIMG